MKTIVCVDLDSTLNCLDKRWLEVYNEEYHDSLTINDITCWDWDTKVKPECGKKIYDILLRPGFFRGLEVRPDAQEVTKWLIEKKNCELHILTAYFPTVVMDKVNWLSEHFPHIPTKNIIFCNHKGLIKAHYLVDDGGHNAEDFSATNPDGKVLLFDAPCPWNHYLGDKHMRVPGWKNVQEYFEEVL